MAKDYAKAFYASKKWKEIRAFVLQRDFYMCRVCSRPNANIVHHIEEITPSNIRDASITLNPDNLVTVCAECHDAIHERYPRQPRRYTFDAEGNVLPTGEDETRTDEKAQNRLAMYRARLR